MFVINDGANFSSEYQYIVAGQSFRCVVIHRRVAWVGGELYSSPYMTGAGSPVEQPVPFSHRHHVRDDGIDCRYCHTSVENSSFAGLPPTKTCMNCHSMIWSDAPMLEPAVRRNFQTDQSIQWIPHQLRSAICLL